MAVRERKLEKLRSAGYDGSPEEWSSILQYVLHPSTSTPDALSEKLRDTLNTTCAISGQDKKLSLNIIIRQSVEGITHKFGSLQLPFSDNTDDVDLFGWAVEIADERDNLATKLRLSNTSVEDAQRTIKSLQEQLQSLITAKEEHETQLLSKFALLLNEKKLRIRSQQRLIADQQLQPASTSALKLRAGKGTSKRKAADHDGSDQGSESDGFDAMDVDQDDVVRADDSDGGRTTAAETDSESDPDPTRARGLSSGSIRPALNDAAAIPPPRELPFGINTTTSGVQSQQKTARAATSDNEETASEDDEL